MTERLLFADENGVPLPSTETMMRTIDTEHNWFWKEGYRDGREGLRASVPDEVRRQLEISDYVAGYWAGCDDRYNAGCEDDEIEYAVCWECKSALPVDKLRRGEDDERYCSWCYDSTGQDPGALQGIDPEN